MGIMGVLALGMMTMQSNLLKTNNFLEFQLKRTQLQGAIVGQFLKDSNNCKCLFAGSTEFPVSGVSVLAGASPTSIGRFAFVTAGVCSTATVPQPMVDSIGVDSLRATSIEMKNIVNISVLARLTSTGFKAIRAPSSTALGPIAEAPTAPHCTKPIT